MFRTLTSLFLTLLSATLFAQMPAPDGSIRYGNEWIGYDQDYLLVQVAEDGMYRIPATAISSAGLSGDLELYHNGAQVPLRLNPDGSVVFYGEKNRGAMDRHLWPDPDAHQLNDRFSMHSDTSGYYLTMGSGQVYQAANVGAGTPSASVLRRSERVFNDHMVKSYFRSGGISIYYSHYDKGEGFGQRSSGDLLSSNGNVESTVTLELPAANGQEATLDVRFGTAFGSHEVEIAADETVLATPIQSGWGVVRETAIFSPNGTETSISLTGTRGDQDKPNLAWAAVTYPATPAYDEALTAFAIPASPTATRVVFTGLGAAAGAAGRITSYAPATGNMVSAEVDGDGTATMDFPAAAAEVTYQLVVGTSDLKTPTTRPLRFSESLPSAGDNYLIITSRRLHGSELEQMANYRRSAAGGSYNVKVTDVEDLYDEFGYGIPNHPMAIRNYLTAARIAAPQLQYLFIVGKGREYRDVRTPDALQDNQATYFIPSFGFPASDNLLAANLGEITPQLSVGRLSAINEEEIGIYFGKLREVEDQVNNGGQTIADRDWMKQGMHLGGGGSASEQSSIKIRLATMERAIQTSNMAASVTPFFKTSSEPIEDSRQDAIFNRINAGTAILTFMGHSSSQTFDFSIDDPANYSNKGRYPFMLSLGCYSGDAFTRERSISERFIFLRDKGAIAFAASKGIGYISALGNWGEELFDNIGNENYGEGIGDAIRGAIENFSSTSNFTLGILLEQFALSGDPAYRLHPRPGTDFVVDPASVSFEPGVVPAQDEQYTMKLRLLNLGVKTDVDSLNLRFRQELPSGEVIDLKTERVAAPIYDGRLEVVLPGQGIVAVGQNRIFVTVDVDDEAVELPAPAAEMNNELETGGREGVSLTFVANTAKVAFPPPYAVVGGELELIASTTNALSPERGYQIQLATDRDYDNLIINETVRSGGGVIRHTPNFSPTDSTTYYWRISPDSSFTQGSGFIWDESSFTWIADRPAEMMGWGQQSPGQLVDGDFININADTIRPGWQFSKTATDVDIYNCVYTGDIVWPRLERGGQLLAAPFPWVVHTGMQFYIFDSTNLFNVYRNPGGGVYNTPNRAIRTWVFDTKVPRGREGMIDFVQNGIPEGKFVFVYSAQRGNNLEYYNEGWENDSLEFGKSIFNVLEEEGALQARGMAQERSVPYAFAFQKGMGPIAEVIAVEQTDTIILSTTLLTNWPEGEWLSSIAGPALSWNQLSLELLEDELEDADSVRVQLFGITGNGTRALLNDDNLDVPETRSYALSLADISVEQYPFLQAKLLMFDSDLRSAPTVKFLYFDYARAGDVAVNPQLAFNARDSIEQGEPFNITLGYENISPVNFDSLLVSLRLITENNDERSFVKRMPPLPRGEQNSVSFEVPSEEFSGSVRYQISLNPDQDQPEEVVFNNNLISNIKIGRDVVSPDLTLFFDGVRINDGDLVSSRPEIHLELRDNNRFLLLNDTSDIRLVLEYPSGTSESINFADERVEFQPATLGNNTADIYLRPELLEDGVYVLNVRANDQSGNLAGRLDFRQEFEVINEQQVANVLTYPNPFTTSTRFVYTLTGNEPPSTFRIQIMTVSGRVVRDIDLAAFEEIKIGTHQTEFAWDGTDEYGDMLANGVYLYRAIIGDSADESLKKYDTGTDVYFKNGIGKVVLLR